MDLWPNLLGVFYPMPLWGRIASEEVAYKFYYAYAKFIGFAIRKDEVRYVSNGEVKRHQFVCDRVGLRNIIFFY